MNYRGFGLAWLVLWWLVAMPAGADTVTLGELNLDTADAWQRANAEEEADFDSIVLRERGASAPLEIYLARHRIRLKMAEAKFIEQLEQSWRRRYGEGLELTWLDIAGTRWRICRRPSQSGDGYVFQIVTVHGGEVYQLVAMAPTMIRALPESVRTFLASAVWGGAKPMEMREPAAGLAAVAAVPPVTVSPAGNAPAAPSTTPAMAVKPAPAAAPIPAPAATTSASVTAAPAPSAGGRWRLLRTVIALPGSKAWPELAEAEGGLLGSEGLVKGLGLSAEAAGIDGFLEGMSWQKGVGAADRQQPYRRHWRVLWPAFPERWQGGGDLAFDLAFMADTAGLEPGGDMTLKFELTPVCAPRIKVVNWLDALEAEGPEGLSQLAGMACAAGPGAPAPATVTVAARDYPAGVAAQLTRHVALSLPAEWERGIRPKSRADVARLVLTARFQISENGRAPGDAMFRRAAVVFIFGPDI